ncbi:MAG: AAA family ATPase [Deltaproteobacteria bacterium]
MRFTRLVVESFQSIKGADIAFGPGLNILYGPNDLGKSTLAAALRAALLLPPTSTEAGLFTPWHVDATPRVSLTFADDAGRYWKVNKGFGSGAASTGAELHHSKDGVAFVLDCKAREVEEKIRGMLAWGIPAPGGKGGPRGVPSSFLANVLLGAQTDVDRILGLSLADDPDETGRLRLTKALSALAQDPLFKRVLDAAQLEVDQCFSATGRRKRSSGSRFVEAAQQVKQTREDLDALQALLNESSAIESAVGALRTRRAEADVRNEEAKLALATLREQHARSSARKLAHDKLEAARATLGAIDAQASRVVALETEVDGLAAIVKAQEDGVVLALADCAAAEGALQAAEEALRLATSGDRAHEEELRRAHLAERTADLNARRLAAQTRRTEVSAAAALRAEAKRAGAAAASARTALEQATIAACASGERVTDIERKVELSRAILAYGRWRAAVMAAEDAARSAQAAATARAESGQKDSAAALLEEQALAIDEALVARRAALPGAADAAALERLERDLQLAEAALGGGLSVAVKPRAGIRIHAVIDQNAGIDEQSLSTERVFEAERSLRLSVGELVDIEITAGAADKRRAVESLRSRWSTEAIPVLARAGVTSVAEITAALATIAKDASSAAELRAQASRLRVDSRGLSERAALQEQQAARVVADSSEIDARQLAIGTADPEVLQASLEKLGKSWETQAEARHAQHTSESRTAQALHEADVQATNLAGYQVSEAEQRAASCAAASDAASAALATEDLDALLRTTDEDLASLTRDQTALVAESEALAAEATAHVGHATQAVEAATAQLNVARQAHSNAVASADKARAEYHARSGERGVLRAQLDVMDREGAATLLAEHMSAFDALPDAPAVSEADLANAGRVCEASARALDAAKEDLHKSEGALSKVGGAAVREEVERTQEALEAATLREKELEVDADAWKLLRDTLRDVENEEGAHLGRALAGPVAAKFGELTGGRYKNLVLDAKLRAESVDAASGGALGATVLEALSVGTRDQLATLIRLTIADQLRTAIVLDDHLVHTDPKRLAWFREALTKTALNTQVIIFTCRPEDYVSRGDLPDGTPARDLAGGSVRVIDVVQFVKRWDAVASNPESA